MQNLDHYIGLRDKRRFFAENGQKSAKTVIITSVTGRPASLDQTFFPWEAERIRTNSKTFLWTMSNNLRPHILDKRRFKMSRTGLPDFSWYNRPNGN
jgi:hypothetical protein